MLIDVLVHVIVYAPWLVAGGYFGCWLCEAAERWL